MCISPVYLLYRQFISISKTLSHAFFLSINYRCGEFQGDLIAGITVGLTVIPQGLAYALVAGLPAQVI